MDEHSEPAPALHARGAHEELEYIRRTLDAAGSFSSIPGRGLVVIGLMALAAVVVNQRVTGAPWDDGARPAESLAAWSVLLALSVLVGLWTMARKARRTGQPVWSPVLRKALWGFVAAMLLGGILSGAVIRSGHLDLLPEIWLGCYGSAMIAGGVMSVAPVRWMGISFLALAAAGAAFAPQYGLLLLAAGFGALHLLFGAYIAWRHDG
ncbi:MAG: hypothetical protein HY234_07215 [Acidobacteria bacterium]|nr:hypothetical protein [Acidobacteriota bacterium]